eukprot:PhM_4_TR7301/c0_g1_i1/m.35744
MTGGPGHCLKGYELNLIDANQRIYPQRVHERSFNMFEVSGMVLLKKHLANPAAQGALRFAQEALMEDAVVRTFDALEHVHRPDNYYQLYPRRCKTTRAFEAMMSICHQPGAPFKMTDRFDPTDVRTVLRSKEATTLEEYNKQNPFGYKMQHFIHFEAILASRASRQVAFIMTGGVIAPDLVFTGHMWLDFLRFWLPRAHQDNEGQAKKFRALLQLCSDKPMLVFAADNAGRDPGVVRQAAERGIYVMQRQAQNNMRFLFVR